VRAPREERVRGRIALSAKGVCQPVRRVGALERVRRGVHSKGLKDVFLDVLRERGLGGVEDRRQIRKDRIH
jgi:hypothetical protein